MEDDQTPTTYHRVLDEMGDSTCYGKGKRIRNFISNHDTIFKIYNIFFAGQ